MDQEEAQYWVDVLPIMSSEQILNLEDILKTEKTQIEEVNKAYESQGPQNVGVPFDETGYIERKRARQELEAKHEEEEAGHEEKLLQDLESL